MFVLVCQFKGRLRSRSHFCHIFSGLRLDNNRKDKFFSEEKEASALLLDTGEEPVQKSYETVYCKYLRLQTSDIA